MSEILEFAISVLLHLGFIAAGLVVLFVFVAAVIGVWIDRCPPEDWS